MDGWVSNFDKVVQLLKTVKRKEKKSTLLTLASGPPVFM